RNYSSCNYAQPNKGETTQNWESINTWLQRDLKNIQGKLIIGQSYTPSDIFDSVRFTGVSISSEDNMLPDSLRGFAPTVKGIANSTSQVTIRQNNIIIYQTTVPPGPFVINDLYPTSASGELNITIRESDGSERTFTQAFSNVPIMQREGQVRYFVSSGKTR
ncbi:fimbria/pilus outer membrane usher protein, partial [Enterobacter cloacae complex sp. P4RS]|uniref:fimbria/pilus outer membrane usher protein n=1 Tax=Enterobacter cloacae complex sp. P4RS TaxID=2779590 RepID=UPI001876F5DA